MRCDLRGDPAVFRVSESLGLPELHVVGCLYAVWAWLDGHSVDGRVNGATERFIDRVAGVDGFAAAMQSVGWLVVDEGGALLPHWERHNGSSAKTRALKTRLQAESRAERANIAQSPSGGKKKGAPAGETGEKAAKGPTRLPPDWALPPEWRAFVAERDASLDADEIASVFRDYWVAKPGPAGRKLDWEATWRNWVRRSPTAKLAQSRGGAGQRSADQVARLTGKADHPKPFDLRVV